MKLALLPIVAASALLLSGCEQPNRLFLVTYEAQMKSNHITRGTTVLVAKQLDQKSLGNLVGQIQANPAITKDGVVILMAIELER